MNTRVPYYQTIFELAIDRLQ